ncbi:MAG TPA: fibronectin type III domain-containing protein [Solirubrobacteraceae bacterium]|nr:fibronectin type III domain-containing protein [Solirubrobacteraceae bacterium]
MAETVRPRTLLLFALVALLGAATAFPALATASVVQLEVNQNCVDPEWPCWTTEGSALRPQPALTVKIAAGDEVMFTDNDTSRTAAVVWMGSAPACTGVPTSASTPWAGKCTFATSGTYKFESSTLFKEPRSAYGNNIDYTKYEIVVAGPPTDATTSASGETQTEAMLNGSIDPEGNTVQYYFEYGSSSVTEHTTSASTLSAADFTSHSVSLPVSGLSAGTEYHFELIVSYGANKIVSGGPQMFKTNAVAAPIATTLAAEVSKETEATLKGTVNLGGEATEYFFEYGTDANYGQKTAKATLQTSAGDNQGVSAALKGLTPGTEYHFRLVAKNAAGGPISGVERTFKTMSTPAKEPTKEPPAKEPTPTPTPTPAPGPTSPEPEIAPLVPALVEGSLKVTAPRHGSSVRGSVEVSKSAAGERLEVDLLANSASLAKVRHKRSASTVVGRLVRASVPAGKVFFSISLNARAKSALRRHHKLALTVQIVLTPVVGAAASVTRSVVLHG